MVTINKLRLFFMRKIIKKRKPFFMKFSEITFSCNGHKIKAETNAGAAVRRAVAEASRLARELNTVVILAYNGDRIMIGPRAKPYNIMGRRARRHNVRH